MPYNPLPPSNTPTPIPHCKPPKRSNADIEWDLKRNLKQNLELVHRIREKESVRDYNKVSDENRSKLLDTLEKKETIMTNFPFKITFQFSDGGNNRWDDRKYRHVYPQGFKQVQFVMDNIKKKDVDINRVRIGVVTQPEWTSVVVRFNPSEIAESDFLKKVFGTQFYRDYTVTHDVVKLFTETVIKTCIESTAKTNFDWDVTISYKFDKKAFLEAWIAEENDFIEEWNHITTNHTVQEYIFVPVLPKEIPAWRKPLILKLTLQEKIRNQLIKLKQWWGQES